jgi:acyl-CoA thioesterase
MPDAAGYQAMQGFVELMAARIGRPAPGQAVLDTVITDDWLQGRSAYGGLQGALGVRAMRAVVDEGLPLRALQVTFIASVGAGPARVVAERVRQGRAVTHAQCRIESGGQTAALIIGLFGAARASRAALPLAPPPAGLKRPDALHDTPFLPEQMPPFLQHYRVRWAEGQRPFTASPPRTLGQWTTLRDPPPPEAAAQAAFNELNLVAIADLPPTPVLSMLEARAPGASLTWLLECLVDPRDMDPAQWLLIRTDARAAGDGYASQTALIRDESDRGIAVSHQTVAVFG